MARADISPYVRAGALGFTLDLEALKADGLGFLIKELRETPNGLVVKVHDSQAALEKVGRIHKLFVEQVEHDVKFTAVNADEMAKAEAKAEAKEAEFERQRFGSDDPADGDMGQPDGGGAAS